MKYQKLNETLKDKAQRESVNAKLVKLTTAVEFLSMMTGVEIPIDTTDTLSNSTVSEKTVTEEEDV